VLDRLLPSGPVVIGIDDTIERRWGARIWADRGRRLLGAPRSDIHRDCRRTAEDADGGQTRSLNLRRQAWGSTFIASLELAKQVDLTLAQKDLFTPIHVSPAPALPPD
jgi:hypothetical protein